MTWWKIVIVYFVLLGAMLWLLHRSRVFYENTDEAPGE
jgi:hypothetical protein